MIAAESRSQKPRRRPSSPNRHTRTRLVPRRPYSESSAGCSVTAAATDTSGIRKPPIPIERMNGEGMKSSSASPIATVAPEKRTARPAVAIVRTTASSEEPSPSSSSRNR
jgi:hypothetical protein